MSTIQKIGLAGMVVAYLFFGWLDGPTGKPCSTLGSVHLESLTQRAWVCTQTNTWTRLTNNEPVYKKPPSDSPVRSSQYGPDAVPVH